MLDRDGLSNSGKVKSLALASRTQDALTLAYSDGV
jgi:hypothetical protein